MRKYFMMFGAAGLFAGMLMVGGCGDDAAFNTTTTSTSAPVVTTTAAPVVTTTAAPVVTTTAAPVVTTTAAPVVTTTAAPGTTTTTVPSTGVITISANTAAVATAAADVFKLTAATTGYSASISGGFNYLTDKISYPAGNAKPSALAEGVNLVTDGKVDLTWNSNGQTVTISLTGLSSIDEMALQSNAVPAIYTTY